MPTTHGAAAVAMADANPSMTSKFSTSHKPMAIHPMVAHEDGVYHCAPAVVQGILNNEKHQMEQIVGASRFSHLDFFEANTSFHYKLSRLGFSTEEPVCVGGVGRAVGFNELYDEDFQFLFRPGKRLLLHELKPVAPLNMTPNTAPEPSHTPVAPMTHPQGNMSSGPHPHFSPPPPDPRHPGGVNDSTNAYYFGHPAPPFSAASRHRGFFYSTPPPQDMVFPTGSYGYSSQQQSMHHTPCAGGDGLGPMRQATANRRRQRNNMKIDRAYNVKPKKLPPPMNVAPTVIDSGNGTIGRCGTLKVNPFYTACNGRVTMIVEEGGRQFLKCDTCDTRRRYRENHPADEALISGAQQPASPDSL